APNFSLRNVPRASRACKAARTWTCGCHLLSRRLVTLLQPAVAGLPEEAPRDAGARCVARRAHPPEGGELFVPRREERTRIRRRQRSRSIGLPTVRPRLRTLRGAEAGLSHGC